MQDSSNVLVLRSYVKGHLCHVWYLLCEIPHSNFSEDKQSIIFNDVTQQQSGSYYCVAAEFMEYLFELSESVQVCVCVETEMTL